jgi:hypothetical protein
MQISIGKNGVRVPTASFKDAVAYYEAAREEREQDGPTAKRLEDGIVWAAKKPIARISYNGRVWNLDGGAEIPI